jgi:hypothetical protein
MQKKDRSMRVTWILFFAALNSTLLVAAIAGGSKIVEVAGFNFAVTVIAYGFTYLMTDLTSEIFGKSYARKVVLIGFVSMVASVGFFHLAIVLPPAPFYGGQAAYEEVFGVAWRFVIGGIIAYVISQNLDVFLFHWLRRLTKGRGLWIRNNGSTLISQAVDTLVFVSIAFVGVAENVFDIFVGQYIVKIFLAVMDTIIIYMVVGVYRKWRT